MNDLLKLMDLNREDITKILDLADAMKKDPGAYRETLKDKTLCMIFEKSSTRTRVSFEVGITQLGGHAVVLSGSESQMGRGEPVADTARVLSRYCDGIMIRTFSQAMVEELARWASIPVINGLTDFEHPCQVLADLMTVREKYGKLEGLTLCFIGDGFNMAHSLIAGGALTGMKVQVACPDAYPPDESIIQFASAVNCQLSVVNCPKTAVAGAHVVVTDTWVSMGQEGAEAEARRAAFRGYCVDDALMSLAAPGAMVLHCLPAYRGEEITAEVFEAHAREIFDEAENRLHAQKAVMALLMK